MIPKSIGLTVELLKFLLPEIDWLLERMEEDQGWFNFLPTLADNIITWELPIWSSFYLDERKLRTLGMLVLYDIEELKSVTPENATEFFENAKLLSLEAFGEIDDIEIPGPQEVTEFLETAEEDEREQFTKQMIIGVYSFLTMTFNYLSLMTFGRTLSQLVALAQEDSPESDKFLCQAIQIDRTILQLLFVRICTSTKRRRISMLYKRPNSNFWWCRFTAPNEKRVYKSTKTVDKRQAQEFEDTFRANLWRVVQLDEKPRRTWKEAVVRWFRENQDKKTINDDVAHIKWVDPFIGESFLDEVTRDKLDDITYAKLDTGVKPATVNRMMEVVRAILNRAYREWEWIDKAPYVRMLKEPQRRIRWLTPEEVQRLISFLPSHLVAMVRFSLATGLRESNVTGLQWSQVDLSRRVAWIHADQAKAGRSIGVPLNNEVIVCVVARVARQSFKVRVYL